MTKLTLTEVKRFDKDRDGNPLKTKDNRPYTRLVIRANGYDKTLSGFDSPTTQNWKAGDEVEVEVEQKGEYLNFKVPNKQDFIGKQLEEMNGRILKILLMVEELGGKLLPKQDKIPGTDIDYPNDDLGEPPF